MPKPPANTTVGVDQSPPPLHLLLLALQYRGHRWRLTDDAPWRRLYVELDAAERIAVGT